MAIYTGMTYTQIRNMAVTLAKKAGLMLEHSEAIAVFDEALLKVGEDVLEEDRIVSATWTESAIDIVAGGYLHPAHVYGDATKLVYIPYDKFREFFLGSESSKPSIDNNTYWTILGNSIYLEPDVTDFTNYVIQYAPRFTAYADKADVSDIPELNSNYRMLVSYKICALLFPSVFEKVYQKVLNEKRAFRDRKLTTGQAEFWDPFEGSKSERRSGNPQFKQDS